MLKRSSLINSTTITATGKKTILRLKKKSEISKEKKGKITSPYICIESRTWDPE